MADVTDYTGPERHAGALSLDREMGDMQARLRALEKNAVEMRADIKSILAVLSEARGGWKAMLAVGAVSGAIGAGVMKASSFIGFMPK